jgi:hypothetical protein
VKPHNTILNFHTFFCIFIVRGVEQVLEGPAGAAELVLEEEDNEGDGADEGGGGGPTTGGSSRGRR